MLNGYIKLILTKIKGISQRINFVLLRYKKMNIQGKLLLSFIVMSFLPLCITAFLTYNKTSIAINSKVSDYATEVVKQISQNISRELLMYKNNSDEILFSSIVQNGMNDYYNKNIDLEQKLSIKKDIGELVSSKFTDFNSIVNVEIITNKDEWIVNRNFTKQSGSWYKDNMKFVNSLTSSKKSAAWFLEKPTVEVPNASKYDLVFVRAINYLLAKKCLGYMIMGINEGYFSEIYKSANLEKDIDIFILDSSGKVMSSRNSNIEVGKQYDNSELINKLKDKSIANNGMLSNDTYSNHNLIAYATIPETGWFVISTIPLSYLNRESKSIGRFMTIVSIICIILALILSYLISKGISDPLKRMVCLMKEVNNRNFDVRIQYTGHDEISVLASNFNSMIEQLDDLIKKEYKATLLKNQAELKALQAQINPHFLYNTLQVMRSIARSQQTDVICDMCNSLSGMFRYSLNMKDDFATVFDEISHLQNYLFIQNTRFPNTFNIRIICNPELYSYKIPRLILQPLVENSIEHGLVNKLGVKLLRIKVIKHNEKIQISVIDNGVGFDEKRLDEIKIQMCSVKNFALETDESIGLMNVYERIRLVFGDNYNFDILSKKGRGSMVKMEFPMQLKEE